MKPIIVVISSILISSLNSLPVSAKSLTIPSAWGPVTELTLSPSLTDGILWGIDCVTSTECTAVGNQKNTTPLYVEKSGGIWGEAMTLDASNVGGAHMMAVSCIGANNCTAVGYSFDVPSEPVYTTKTNGQWGPLFALNAAPFGGGSFRGLSCTKTSECTAVGNDNNGEPIYANKIKGIWGPVKPIPALSLGGGILFGVSCTKPHNCTAVGTNNVSGLGKPMYVQMVNGKWGKLTLLDVTNPNGAIFRMVSCPKAGYCTAVGYDYNSTGGHNNPIYASETKGIWGTVSEIDASAVGGGMLTGVSCKSLNDCTAAGVSNTVAPIYATKTSKGWSSAAALIVNGDATFNRISCISPNNCTAIGYNGASQPIYSTLSTNNSHP